VDVRTPSRLRGQSASALTLWRHLMPGNEDEAAGLLDAYLSRPAEFNRGIRDADVS
jgi:hypothetical protein